LAESPLVWLDAIASLVATAEPDALPLAITAARRLPGAASHANLRQALLSVVDGSQHPPELQVAALAVIASELPEASPAQFALLTAALSPENAVAVRSAAADALSQAPLTDAQLEELCKLLPAAGPLEVNRLLAGFERSADEQLGLALLSSLRDAAALPSIRFDVLRLALAKYPATVHRALDETESLVNVDAAAQRQRIEQLLPLVTQGDVRRGQAVFYSSKAACSACHQLGYTGGAVGPELTRIGEIRTERDLLESILYPSLSFVQSYESMLMLTIDGRAINGRILEESADAFLVATGPEEETRVRREDVEETQPSTVSVMPAGLDRQLSEQELLDLVAFLKHAK
jgi:putative heme-binding domain-containing protein